MIFTGSPYLLIKSSLFTGESILIVLKHPSTSHLPCIYPHDHRYMYRWEWEVLSIASSTPPVRGSMAINRPAVTHHMINMWDKRDMDGNKDVHLIKFKAPPLHAWFAQLSKGPVKLQYWRCHKNVLHTEHWAVSCLPWTKRQQSDTKSSHVPPSMAICKLNIQ